MNDKLIKRIIDLSRDVLIAGDKKTAKSLYDLAGEMISKKREKVTGKKPIAHKKLLKKKPKIRKGDYKDIDSIDREDRVFRAPGGACGGGGYRGGGACGNN